METINLEDLIDNKLTTSQYNSLGKYKGQDLYVKKGKYGLYAQWGKETKTLNDEFGSLESITYIDVIRYLDRVLLDINKPVGLVRELNKNISIRNGKYGDYIFYKKPRVKKPLFFKLNEFNGDYKKCDKLLVLNWIKEKYNIE